MAGGTRSRLERFVGSGISIRNCLRRYGTSGFILYAMNERRPMAKALLLDRDGVINEDHGYVCREEDFDFIDGIFDLCRSARDNDFLLILVVNQAGIGRGYYDEARFHELTDWMKQQFDARGAPITEVYFCPYHATAGVGKYRRESSWRKPAPGMLLQAAKDHDIDLARSAMIGNAPSDMAAAAAAGVGLKLLYDPAGSIAVEDDVIVCRSHAEASRALLEFARA